MAENTEQAGNPDQGDLSLMQAFVQQHGDAPVEGREAPKAAQQPDSEPASPPAPPPGDEEDDLGDLDPRTLEALGMMDEEGPVPAESGKEGDTAQPVRDLSALASSLGLEETDLALDNEGRVLLKTKVDGEEATVPLQELRKGYQLQKHFTKQQEAFLAERTAWEEARRAQQAQLGQQEHLASEILNAEEQKLNQEYTRDWQALRQEDPAEYAAQVAEYNQKLQQIHQRKANLYQAIQQRQQEMQQQMQQRGQEEAQKLLQAFGWTPETVEPHATRLREYLVASGITPEEIQSTVDHRAFVLAEKARRYDEWKKRIDLAKRKVKDAPTMPRGSAAQPESGQSSKLKAAKARLGKEHSTEAAAEVFKHLKVV